MGAILGSIPPVVPDIRGHDIREGLREQHGKRLRRAEELEGGPEPLIATCTNSRVRETSGSTATGRTASVVLVVADPFLAGERVRIADEMIKNKLPSIYSYHEHVRAGGLMTYTTNYYDVFRRQGLFIDKIFKGAKAGDLPVQQPIKFELMLNLKTANALDLAFPPSLLALADEVIE